MTEQNPDDVRRTIDRLRSIASDWRPMLADDSDQNVTHYLDNGEVEMAYESMILSAMDEHLSCTEAVANELYAMGLELRLDKSSVFDSEFWTHAAPYLRNFFEK